MNKLNISSPLVSIEWLHANLHHSNLVILDGTIPKVDSPDMPEAFQRRDIPGTRFFDLKKVFRDTESDLSNTMPSPEKFALEAGKLGIGNDSVIIVYDHWGIYSSARVWWMFRSMGHTNVAVLDGGFPAWEKAGYPTVPSEKYHGPERSFIANPQPGFIIGADEVLKTISQKDKTILDARSEGRFYARVPEPREDMRSGHIPGSINLHYAKLVKDGMLIPAEELKTVFGELADEGKPVIFSCGSGITACILALGASVANRDNLSVYDGSWSEWGSREDLPIEV
ncbi:MAG: sulfurtransferase [Bacteroidetes bacterium]|nr:sulfurtransferase [Bacteroidota bacterium]